MIQYPITFSTSTTATSGTDKLWTSTNADSLSTQICVPVEFEGCGGGLSPEDLFNQALANCFIATFKVYAQHSRLNFENLEVSSNLIVDLDANKKPVMKDFHLHCKITSPSNKEKALLLAKRASQSGFILNSVKTHCHFDFAVT